MTNIFLGFFLVFLDFNITWGSCTIGLIPDFLGYLFLVSGVNQMAIESRWFAKARPFGIGMGIYSGLLYLFDLFGLSVSMGVLGTVLGLVSAVIALYIASQVVAGVQEMEISHQSDLNGSRLQSNWGLMAFFQIIAYVSLLIPALTIVFLIISAIASIAFLASVHKSKKLYEALPRLRVHTATEERESDFSANKD